jgi:hypothetical protein
MVTGAHWRSLVSVGSTNVYTLDSKSHSVSAVQLASLDPLGGVDCQWVAVSHEVTGVHVLSDVSVAACPAA